MSNFGKSIGGITALAIFTLGVNLARADRPAPPMSHTTASADGKFIFVMLPADEDPSRWNEETQAKIKSIRATYPRSGLYAKGEAKKPLWAVDWYASRVLVPNRGDSVIRFGPWANLADQTRNVPVQKTDLDQEALTIFVNGKALRTYKIAEFVDEAEKLPRTVSHFTWSKQEKLDDAKGTYQVDTHDGNRVVIDLKTGKLTKGKTP